MALAREGVEVVISARTKADIEATAEEIRKATGAKVTALACDVTTEEGRKQILAACPKTRTSSSIMPAVHLRATSRISRSTIGARRSSGT